LPAVIRALPSRAASSSVIVHRSVASGKPALVPNPADPRDDSVLASAYGQLLGLLVESPDMDAFLDKMVHLAAQVVTPAAGCGLTVRRDGQPFSAAVSNDLAAQVDEIQYGTDEGPCLDAMAGGTVVQVDDLSQEQRWDGYRPHAVAKGVVSSLSLPLMVDGESLGALNLYSATPAGFVGPQRARAEEFAAQCAAALTLSLRQVRQLQVQNQLAEAMVSSSVIDQAIGILMSQQRCNAAAAFDLLRRASQNRNRKLRDIATDIITNVSGEPPQPRPGFSTNPGGAAPGQR
jgi:GAF domain-containing protein